MGPSPIGHLGPRVSALLDGRLSSEEEDRAWAHVHSCHACRDLVEREGWIKTRLAGLSPQQPVQPPPHLVGSLLGLPPRQPADPDRLGALGHGAGLDQGLGLGLPGPRRPALGLVALGGGAVGAAVLGVLALGTAPADAPSFERRVPVTQLVTPSPAPAASPSPGRRQGR